MRRSSSIPGQTLLKRLKTCLPDSLTGGPETAAYLAVVCAASFTMISIWLAERCFEAAIIAVIWLGVRERRPFTLRLPFSLPLAVFFFWTLFASIAAGENPVNRHTLGKFYILVLLFIVPPALRGAGRAAWACKAMFLAAAAASIAGIVQFVADPHRSLLDRITGFQSTWMNFSGQLMLVLVVLSAYAFCFGMGKKWWVLLPGLLITAAIALSLTRNAWMGVVIGLGTVILIRRPRLTPILAAVLLVLYLAAPTDYQQRLLSGLNPADPNTANRIELFQTSMRLIREHPWFGVGPNSVASAALHYRGKEVYLDWMYQHMHNNLLQIAAERGIPGLLIWMWFMGRLAWDSWRVFRRAGRGGTGAGGPEALLVSTAALGAFAALMCAGLFEYNYGSSPVLILYLFIAGAPYAFCEGRPAPGGPEFKHGAPGECRSL